MSSITHIDQILRAIRVEAADKLLPNRASIKPKGADQGEATSMARPDVPTLLAAKVQAIGEDDPDRRRRAFRLFLEGIMASMFSPAAATEPAFGKLLDRTQGAMEDDAQLREAADQVGELLLQEAKRARETGDSAALAALLRQNS
jgi:hypothetical protein